MNHLGVLFLDRIPEDLVDGTVYVSMTYATATHRCACGCGGEVVTPITPTDWTLIYDGDTVTLRPSISNSSSGCGAHYFITNSTVRWCRKLKHKETADRKRSDRRAKDAYFDKMRTPATPQLPAGDGPRRWLGIVLRRFRPGDADPDDAR